MRDDDWEAWVRDALKGQHLHEPPRAVLRRAVALGDGLVARRKSSLAWTLRLLFDSALEPVPVGLRGTTAGERRLLFECRRKGRPGHQLDLRVRQRASGRIELTGQLLPPWVGARAEVRAGRTRRSRPLGPAGEFLFRDLPARLAKLELAVLDDSERFDVPALILSAREPE